MAVFDITLSTDVLVLQYDKAPTIGKPLGCPGGKALAYARTINRKVILTGAPAEGFMSDRTGGRHVWGLETTDEGIEVT